MRLQCVPVSFYGMLKNIYIYICKILLAHGLPNAQYLLAPFDFNFPLVTGRVEMSNPVKLTNRWAGDSF